MCDTSNMPAPSRTAVCSALTPAYCTGMSQPPNGTILAPARRWAACSGVRFSSVGSGVFVFIAAC